MLHLIKLYSTPSIFRPIEFRPGVNVICGEKSDPQTIRGRKTNGVGKSLCIEFIDFCLLANSRTSRVLRIPRDQLPSGFEVALDLQIGDKRITIRRSVDSPETPVFVTDGQEVPFRTVEDASRCLMAWLYANHDPCRLPSFRQLMAPLIRDERSEFKEVGGYFDTSLRIPQDYTTPLFFLAIDLDPYEQAKKKVKEIKDQGTYIANLKKSLTQNKRRTLGQVQSEINSLSDEVKKISKNLESLKSNEAFEVIEQDLIQIENRMESLRTRRKAVSYELRHLTQLSRTEEINDEELVFLYNDFRAGLGDMIGRSLAQVKEFKAKIDDFQRSLVAERAESLQDERAELNNQLRWLEEEHTRKLALLDDRGVLADMKTTLAVYHEKSQTLSRLGAQYQGYEEGTRKKKILDAERGQLIVTLDLLLLQAKERIDSLRATILEIHERIMGNKEASFRVETVSSPRSKQVIQIELRIYDDGSHSVDRSKIFIFDTALLFNEDTAKRHPHFLVHDNIFDVDQDTLVQSLNYLESEESRSSDFQYVLTLNRDKIEHEERLNMIHLDIESHKIATFTKQQPFLSFHYQELKSIDEQSEEAPVAEPDEG